MAGALTRFALLSGGVIVLVVVGVVIASQALAEEEARRDATVRVQGMACGPGQAVRRPPGTGG